MAASPGTRISSSVPYVSFDNFDIGTTPNFVLPAGVGELQYDAVDPNYPGVLTLQQIYPPGTTITIGTLNTSMGDIPGYTGSFFFQTAGGVFNINTTVMLDAAVIYFVENGDIV